LGVRPALILKEVFANVSSPSFSRLQYLLPFGVNRSVFGETIFIFHDAHRKKK
jgi:hypothetical protein